MNILLVTETYLPYLTGVSISTDSIARTMISRGHKVTIINPKPVVKGTITPLKGLRIVNVPSIPFAIYNNNAIGLFPLAFPIISKVMKEARFDVVHIQEPGPTGVSALLLAKIHHIPIVGALHFFPEQVDRVIWGIFERVFTPFINIYIRLVYNHYDAIMTPSHFFEGFLKKLGIKKPISVISNGVDTSVFHPTIHKSSNTVTFLYLGRLDGDKNVATLVKAMTYTDKNVGLFILGKGKNINSLHKLAEKLNVEEKIKWKDYITDDEMIDTYRRVDVFVIMSPYEGQSIVTLQAVASGLPIIAADASALPEIVKNNENGFLVEPYDYKTLAKKMNLLAQNKSMRERFGQMSRNISLKHHKPTVLHELELLYKDLIAMAS
jgi:glycosyltransferase involved in cell wall biosynthesis